MEELFEAAKAHATKHMQATRKEMAMKRGKHEGSGYCDKPSAKTAAQQYGMQTGAPADVLRITALMDYVLYVRANMSFLQTQSQYSGVFKIYPSLFYHSGY